MLETPIAFLIFNRPDHTRRVFREIARARPRRLLIVADGARNPDEAVQCEQARAVAREVDWDCEVLTNFSDANMGCRRRVSSGLEWVFDHCEEAIILEDDCVPDPTFFPFCADLLEKYRNDERVGVICGTSFDRGSQWSSYSYHFALHVTAWGWAAWRRTWRSYDVGMKLWQPLRETSWLDDMLIDPVAVKYWREVFDQTYAGEIDTWDYQFFFSFWAQNSLAIMPNTNLITNIGFGGGATHTHDFLATMAELAVAPVTFPLRHPPYVFLDRAADRAAFRRICPWIPENQNLYWRARHRISRALPDSVRRTVSSLRARRRGGAR